MRRGGLVRSAYTIVVGDGPGRRRIPSAGGDQPAGATRRGGPRGRMALAQSRITYRRERRHQSAKEDGLSLWTLRTGGLLSLGFSFPTIKGRRGRI